MTGESPQLLAVAGVATPTQPPPVSQAHGHLVSYSPASLPLLPSPAKRTWLFSVYLVKPSVTIENKAKLPPAHKEAQAPV